MFYSLDYFEIDKIEVFVDISLSYFSESHTPRKIWWCRAASDVNIQKM